MNREKSSAFSWILAVVVVLAIAAAGIYVVRRAMRLSEQPAPAPATSATATAPAGTAAPAIRHPIGEAAGAPASAATAPLPALADSDASVAGALAALAGGDGLRALLQPTRLIERIVATVDALPRRGINGAILPLRPPQGAYAAVSVDGRLLPGDNTQRYAPYMRVLEAADIRALAAWYVHYYPLFQQAYADLGYPKGYFNDRLIEALDDLLAAPEPAPPPALAQPASVYVYADPDLEGRSNGQRLMIRVGAADEARIKARLRELRAALTEQAPPGR